MGLLKRLITGTRSGRPRALVEFEVTDPVGDITDIKYWASRGEELRLVVPGAKLRTWGAFGFGGGWNPMMPAFRDDFETFSAFFEAFQPQDLSDMYFLERDFGPAGLAPLALPWFAGGGGPQTSVAGESRVPAAPARERRFFGPTSAKTIETQFKRTQRVTRSIREQGYRPERYGDIQGYFLRHEGDYRFVVKGGKHRATALTHTGRETVPVRLRPGWPRVIEADRVHEWPLVRSGRMGEDYALAVMRRFFEFDGTQQRDRIFGASGPGAG